MKTSRTKSSKAPKARKPPIGRPIEIEDMYPELDGRYGIPGEVGSRELKQAMRGLIEDLREALATPKRKRAT